MSEREIVEVQQNATKDEKVAQKASFSETFADAELYDYLLMILGTFGAFGTGCALPIFNYLFGELMDNMNNSGDFMDKINYISFLFAVVSAGVLVCGFLQVYCWALVGERQTQRFRMKYVRAILSQEIGWFDTTGAAQLPTKVAHFTSKVMFCLLQNPKILFLFFV